MMENAALAYKKKKRGATAYRALIADFVKEFKDPTGDPSWDEDRGGGWTSVHENLRAKIEDVTPRLFL